MHLRISSLTSTRSSPAKIVHLCIALGRRIQEFDNCMVPGPHDLAWRTGAGLEQCGVDSVFLVISRSRSSDQNTILYTGGLLTYIFKLYGYFFEKTENKKMGCQGKYRSGPENKNTGSGHAIIMQEHRSHGRVVIIFCEF